MRRTPIVVTATVAGLAGVLAFHTSPAHPSVSALPVASGTAQSQGTGGGTGTGSGDGGTPAPNSKAKSGSKAKPKASEAAQPGATKTVDGPQENYNYGVLSVSVTEDVASHKIVKVGIASLEDDGSIRSEQIDQMAIPILEQEALQAQSASIQSVSGASFTSAGFEQSLQGALHSLGLA
jgi:uncharacterized protein with FMN-binding domain